MCEDICKVLDSCGHPEICVLGDLMLDAYVWGRVDRVSPEGPIPVLHVGEKEYRPGGAGSVATMLRAMEASVRCVGVIGQDPSARRLVEEMEGAGIDVEGVVRCDDRPTTVKTRYLGYVQSAGRGVQQLLRVDEESTSPINDDIVSDVLDAQKKCLESADLLLIQDMAKGLFSPKLLQKTIRLWRDAGKAVVVDPRRAEDYSCYSGAHCLLPNRMEAELATGLRLAKEEDYAEAARKMLADAEVGSVVITLDREGMYFAMADGRSRLVPTVPRGVVDVTGAGDMVSSMISLSLASGVSFEDSVELANVAAGIEVSRQGAMPVSRAEVVAELESKASPAASKIRSREELKHILDERRRRGDTVAFTNGVFDLLHLGHVELIRYARSQADCLVVALNSDRSVRENKGPDRPINPEHVRAQTLAALPNVDYVVVFDEASVLPVVEELRPDVLVKGADYKSKQEVVGWDVVESYGGKVMRAPLVEGLSTTEIIRRINGQPAE